MPRGREARVNCTPAGEPLGISIAIGADELRELGIDPEAVDHVQYKIEDGQLRLTEPQPETDAREAVHA